MLHTEFGYVHLDMKALMLQELKRGSVEGQSLEKSLEAGLIPPSYIRINLLKRAFALSPAPSYIITGFLKSVTEALEFEKEICGIKIIANYIISDLDEYIRLHHGNPNREKWEIYRSVYQDVIDFYMPLNIVRNVDTLGVPDKIFKRLKQAIQPEVFFIVGVPGCGKSTLGKKMAEKYHLDYINLESILWEKNVNNQTRKINDDDSITKKLMLAMEQVSSMRFLIEGFPMNLYQLKQFEIAFGLPKKLFYLALYKEELILRCKKPQISLEYAEYIRKAGTMIDYAESKPYFSRINVNLSVDDSLAQIGKEIEPEVVMVYNDKNNLIITFLAQQGYQSLDLNEAMKSVCSRQTEKGKEIIRLIESGKFVSGRTLIEIMQEFIYSGSTFGKKFVLCGNYPSKVKELEFIERNCVKIQKLYYWAESVENSYSIIPYVEEEKLETYMFRTGRFVRFLPSSDYMTDYTKELADRIDRAYGKYIIFLGSTLSGKSKLATRYAEKTGYKLISYNDLPDIIKAKKSTEDEPYENATFDDIVSEIYSYMKDPLSTIILDGIPKENLVLQETEAVADDEEPADTTEIYLTTVFNKFIEILGLPYLIFHLSSDMKYLKQRLFKSLELGPEDELNEDQLEPLIKSIKADGILSAKFQDLNKEYPPNEYRSVKKIRYYEINTSYSEDKSFAYIKSIASAKLVLIEETAQKEILKAINNICINHDLVHLNVPILLKSESLKNTERGIILSSLLKQNVSIPTNIIISVLQDSLQNLLIGDQLVIISQFLVNKDPYQYPRSMDEFIAIEECLGDIVGVIVVTPRLKKRNVDIDNIPVIHYPPPKKEEDVPKNEEEEEEGAVQKPPEEILPPRSDPRKPVNLPKMFQLYKRSIPNFVNWDENSQLEDAVMKVFEYVALRKYLSSDDHERLCCPNIQILN